MGRLLTELKGAAVSAAGAGWWVTCLCAAVGADRLFMLFSTVVVSGSAGLSWLVSADFKRKTERSGIVMRAIRMTAWLSALTAASTAFLSTMANEAATRSNVMDVVLIVLVFAVPGGVLGSVWAALATSSSSSMLTKAN
jgi:hypothetical protein